jgi:signal transduction histidine kinase
VVFSVFQYLTLGPSSPFFVYFVFSLFCGAVRWGWKGTLWTAPVVGTAFVVMGAWMSRTLGPTEFELNRFIIRIGYLVMVAALLVYLGRHEARLRQNIERLARWPAVGGMERAEAFESVLAQAAAVVGASSVTVVWEADDAAGLGLASWSSTGFDVSKRAPDAFIPVVPEPLANATFMCAGPPTASSDVAVRDGGVSTTWHGLPIHEGFLSVVGNASLLSSPFQAERIRGRVFLSGIDFPTGDALPLGEVVAKQIGVSVDQFELHDRQRRLAIGEERVRLARDLHDGVLQSLTGVRFELQSLVSRLENDEPDGIRDRLLAMERGLAVEQRELRLFIEGLKPFPRLPPAGVGLAARLETVRERVMSDWNVPIVIRVHDSDYAASSEVDEAIPRMIQEAIVNAIRHGQPSRVTVDVATDENATRVIVVDDGRGFPFRGRYDHAQLAALNIGPVSLRDRVASLGGELAVESCGVGSRVEIRLPMTVTRA